MNKIFDNYIEFKDKSNEINELFCSDDGKRFIVDVYDSFKFEQFGKIVRIDCNEIIARFNFAVKQIIFIQVSKTLSTMVTIAFHQAVRIENSNLTSVVRNVKSFVAYLDARKVAYLNWTIFQTSDEWAKAFTETQLQGRLDM